MPRCERVGVEFAQHAPVVAKAEVTVASSPSRVWQVLNQTERWPEWFDGMTTARVTSAEWDGLGSTRFVKVGPLAVEEEMVAWEPDQLWGFCAIELNHMGWVAKRLLEMVEISPQGSGSRLVYTGAVEPVPWLRPFGGLLKRQVASAWGKSLPNIDRQVELGL